MQDNSIILNRLKKNFKSRKSFLKTEKTTAFRLYEKDIPEYPFIIDVYNDHAVVYEKGKAIDEDSDIERQLQTTHRRHVAEAVAESLNIPMKNIILKERARKKGNEQYTKRAMTEQFDTIIENELKLRVNLFDYLDTGLFLDHRPLRKIIKQDSDNKKVLNLFSYTGSISVAAAVGGAHVTTVDMSKKYMAWAKQNFEENDIDPAGHEFIQVDVLQYLSEPSSEKFDIIIFDPPSFSNSKKMEESFNIQDFHEKMIHNLMQKLAKDGVLYFSNNYRKFKLDQSIINKYNVEDITYKSIPKDFRDRKIHICLALYYKSASTCNHINTLVIIDINII